MEVYYFKNIFDNSSREYESVLFLIGSKMFEINKMSYNGEDTLLQFRTQYVKSSNYRLLSDTDYILDENVRNFMLEYIPEAFKHEECSAKFKKNLIKLLIKIKKYT